MAYDLSRKIGDRSLPVHTVDRLCYQSEVCRSYRWRRWRRWTGKVRASCVHRNDRHQPPQPPHHLTSCCRRRRSSWRLRSRRRRPEMKRTRMNRWTSSPSSSSAREDCAKPGCFRFTGDLAAHIPTKKRNGSQLSGLRPYVLSNCQRTSERGGRLLNVQPRRHRTSELLESVNKRDAARGVNDGEKRFDATSINATDKMNSEEMRQRSSWMLLTDAEDLELRRFRFELSRLPFDRLILGKGSVFI